MKSLKRNLMLDFLKGLGCIGVVFIHYKFPGMIGELIFKISAVAVPIFFMISGFYAYDENGDAFEKLKRRAFRITKITLYACLIYIFYSFLLKLKHHEIGLWLRSWLSVRTWVKILIMHDFSIISAGHLWFLPALLYSYLIMMLLDYKKKYEAAYRWIVPLFAIKIVMYIITAMFGLSWHYNASFIYYALPYVLLGNWIASSNVQDKFTNRQLLMATLLSCLYSISFILFSGKVDVAEPGTILFAVSLFLLALKNPQKDLCVIIRKLGSKYSLYIYIVHFGIGRGYCAVGRGLHISEKLLYQWTCPIAIAIFSIITSIVISQLLNRMQRIKAAVKK